MARIRSIKSELFSDGALSECCRDARLLFIGLFPFVDDMGRRRYSAKQLKNEVFPGDTDIDAQKVAHWFNQLCDAGVVEKYSAPNLYGHGSVDWFRITNFLKHQVITHPTHTESPQAPSENGAPKCRCDRCERERKEQMESMYRSVPTGTSGIFESTPENSGILQSFHAEGRKEGGKEGVKTKPTPTNSNSVPGKGVSAFFPESSPTSAENRRAERAALDEIAMRMLGLLKLEANPTILMELAESIRIKARSKACSLELAGQQIMARAAFVATESPPEDWLLWMRDARYEYVPQGDSRLKERRIEARPTCGGPRCEEGWEIVKVQGQDRLRRCQDCAKLWDR